VRPFARVISQISRARDIGARVADQWKDLGTRIVSDLDTGWPVRHGGVGGRGSDTADPTALAAIGRVERGQDPSVRQVDRFHQAVDDYERSAIELEHATNALMGLDPTVAYELADRINRKTASCENCSRTVLQTRDDRLRAGRCHECYEYWRTHHDDRGDRLDRPRELWDPHVVRETA